MKLWQAGCIDAVLTKVRICGIAWQEAQTLSMDRYEMIEKINNLEDFQRIADSDLDGLAAEIRHFLVDKVSQCGGHLASNLGIVELTIALDRVFDSPRDKIIFDVGHQSYVHKILTGRGREFDSLRKQNGLFGFPKREESVHDAFNTGHSSTSISGGLGMLRALRLQGMDSSVVAVIGDGALTGGMCFEALNDAGESELPLIVVLNDNDMSIARNVGAITKQLSKMRASRGYIALKRRTAAALLKYPRIYKRIFGLKSRIKYFILPHNAFFEEMGFTYLGPIDGHNIRDLMEVLRRAKAIGYPVIIHAVTKKGKGYRFAEEDPCKFHGIGAFDPATGIAKSNGKLTNSILFGRAMCDIAAKDDRIVAIAAAMADGTGLEEFAAKYPQRFFDVGIAEQHAVTMAAGMAACGMKPVVAIYSTFLQRAYDQVLHDVALQNLGVIFAIDRAGLVGEDGETHQGVYDIAYLQTIPNLDIYSPATQEELACMLSMAAIRGCFAAVRYNRGLFWDRKTETPVEYGKWEVIRPIRPVTVVATGRMVEIAQEACRDLDAGLVNARFIRPADRELAQRLKAECRIVISVEDGICDGGFGSALAGMLSGCIEVQRVGVGSAPVLQATVAQQMECNHMDAASLKEKILAALERTRE